MADASSQSNPRRAARQVWALAALGLLSGVVTLVIFGWVLLDIRRDRDEADLFQAQAASFLSECESRLAEGNRKLINLLSPAPNAMTTSNWLSALRGLVTVTLAEAQTPLVLEKLERLSDLLAQLETLQDACLAWRSDREYATQRVATSRDAADASLAAIVDAVNRTEAQQRLRDVVDVRKYRDAEGAEAGALADRIIERVSSGSAGAIGGELAKLELLGERLANQDDLDGLTDLKDNEFRPTLASTRHELVKLMEQHQSLPINESTLVAYEQTLFGTDYVNDRQEQTIKTGTDGLYAACVDALELGPVREELMTRVNEDFTELRGIQLEISTLAQDRGKEIAEDSEQLLRNALIIVLLIGTAAATLFIVLAARIAGQIRGQVLRLAERDLESRLVHGSAEIAAETDSFDDALLQVVDLVCEMTGWPIGHAYAPDSKDPDLLRPTRIWHVTERDRFAKFIEMTEQTSYHRGEGLPGRILRDEGPAWIGDVVTGAKFPRTKVAGELGIHGAFGFPVQIEGEIVAVLEFFSEQEFIPGGRLIPMMRNVASQLSRVFERKRAAEELERARIVAEGANRAKSEFLSNMSHELRTPLNGVLGYAQILRRDPDATPAQVTALDSIENCGQHLLTLINDVLDLSKIDAGRLEVVTEAVDLHRLLKSVFDIITPKGEAKGLEITLHVSPEVPVGIITDGTKLKQTLINLLGNAVKFTDEGSVTLDVRDVGGDILEFVVADTGIGMTPEELDGIFDPFRQAEGGKTAGGTGLGLAISKRIIEAQDGALLVESVRGEGSRFTIRIPLVEASDKAMTAVQEETLLEQHLPVLADGQDHTILIVDDRPANRDILVQLLESAGFTTVQAEDGRIALDRLAEQRVPLVLMDVRMPVMNGIDATKAIRDDDNLKDITVIAVTASVFPDFKQRIAEAGFDDFVGKPFRAAEIFAKIEKFLDVTFVDRGAGEVIGADDESGETVEQVPGITAAAAAEVAARLREALKVKSVSALNTLARELSGRDAGTAAVGERIAGFARAFDFAGIGTIADELEATATAAS